MSQCDFYKDKEFSENPAFWVAYDLFYESDIFKKKYLSYMYKRNVPSVIRIDRTEDLLVQKGVGIDSLIVLSNGTSLPVDEKTDRYKHANSKNLFLEIMSNPSSGFQKEGWAYHRGRYICYSCSNETETGLFYEPCFFFIDDSFINKFTRGKYPLVHCENYTNGLYRSLGKLVPRSDIESFMIYLENK